MISLIGFVIILVIESIKFDGCCLLWRIIHRMQMALGSFLFLLVFFSLNFWSACPCGYDLLDVQGITYVYTVMDLLFLFFKFIVPFFPFLEHHKSIVFDVLRVTLTLMFLL